MEKQRIYDEIISVSISNAGAERQRNGICLIRDFDPDNPRHMLYYEASLIYCSVIDEPLYLCMPWHKYAWFLFHHLKSRKQLKFMSMTKVVEKEVDKGNDFIIANADTLTGHIFKWAHDTYELTEEEFDGIYGEVYKAYDDAD